MSEFTSGWVRRFSRAGTPEAVYEAILEAAIANTAADRAEIAMEDDERLVVRATAPTDADTSVRTYPLWTGLIGGAFAAGTTCIVDDTADTRSTATTASSGDDGELDYRSLCCAPFGEYGLLVLKARAPGSFDATDEAAADQLAEICGEALLRFDEVGVQPFTDGSGSGLTDAESQLEEIGDILSHDLTNPLNIVEGSLELARESPEEEHLDRAETALDRAQDLIDQVIFLARTGELVEETALLDFEAVVTEAWENVQTWEATLVVESSATIESSERAIRQIFQNLFVNAIEHVGPTVTVQVGMTSNGFYVEDDGPGIPEADRKSVFERGYSTAPGNTGLGLNIVEKIASAHGWDVRVGESETGGARFEFCGVTRR